MNQEDITAKTIYKFLQKLVARNPDDAVYMLQDIIVNYCIFPNGQILDFDQFSEIEKQISHHMNNGEKIMAIKITREHFGMSLVDAKKFVEARNWTTNSVLLSKEQKKLALLWMQKISKDFKLNDC
jgi:hypothetical protein